MKKYTFKRFFTFIVLKDVVLLSEDAFKEVWYSLGEKYIYE